MKYKKFIIENYRGITDRIEINVEKKSLLPIIGINECGKTTILNAIYAFDYMNDWQNKTFSHLTDIMNLYKVSSGICSISAVVNVTKAELKESMKSKLQLTDTNADEKLKRFYDTKEFEITITRKLVYQNNQLSSFYEFYPKLSLKNPSEENDFCKELILKLPYILYFDDFREIFPDIIEITSENQNVGWLPIIQELFIQTDESYSVYDLKNLEERRRKSILAQVKRKLNATLTAQWSNFRLENKDALEIDIDFKIENKVTPVIKEIRQGNNVVKQRHDQEIEKYFLKFDLIERDSNGIEHYFYIKNRSKGFYWFFNFVMKLEFNPDKAGDLNNAIYLLDEPGSYLHPYAQTKLCKKLKELSNENIVIYCTHSHYLLNPETIPLNNIHVVNKNELGDIVINLFHQYQNQKSKGVETAFQTINEALFLKPFDIDINNKKIMIVEGIYDYYAYSLFNHSKEFSILPGKGSESLINFISLMIAFEVDFRVLWDNDSSGNISYEKAKTFFGDEMANKHFFLLPSKNGKKRILQDLFEPIDLSMINNALQLNDKVSFEKKISSLFFDESKNEIVKKISQKTKDNFNNVFRSVIY
ncbi:MAG: AAA family ATPase [Ignavibacteriae bacterium]|nr:AAA family ATPase [Ignavibacteriota bacterium]